MSGKYTIGIDYGTLSARAVLVAVADGAEIGEAVYEYPHGVMSEKLPGGAVLPPDYALQHPQDYIDSLRNVISEVLRITGVAPNEVIGVAVDTTACTLLPLARDYKPLCFSEGYADNPHAYIKLWKHHSAQSYANYLNDTAAAMGERWLTRYGGKISSEWVFPKILETLAEGGGAYRDTHRFMELTDWITFILTGNEVRSACTAGYKAIWHKREGFPDKAFFKALNKDLENVIEDKFGGAILPPGARAGVLSKSAAALTGLKEGTAVAVGNVDAHVAAASLGMNRAGDMLMVMGTSTCDMLLGDFEREVGGICGAAEDGILPGFIGYEAGQSCTGDHFKWFIENCVPSDYAAKAQALNKSVFDYLNDCATALRIGESGLVALDWWNGNRSILADVDLSGMIIGLTLATKPHEIYRALIEALAFSTKVIIDNFEGAGVPVKRLFAAGGISKKNALMMQIYADVIGLPIYIAGSAQAPAHGSAIFAAVAAGTVAGGYADIEQAARAMAKVEDKVYYPNADNHRAYLPLFEEYKTLHDYFAKQNDVMKRLKVIKNALFN